MQTQIATGMRWHLFVRLSVINKRNNPQLQDLSVAAIALSDAKPITTQMHYMKTWPQGAKMAYGLFYKGKCVGVMVLGYAPTTETKVKKHCAKIGKQQYIELQRTWISDAVGHNAESWMMSRVMQLLKLAGVWVVLTHSGGCKDDVGFIFQASGWLYFGCEKCNDFYRTQNNEYKNLVSAMRFGRVPADVMKSGPQATGEYLYGPGEIVYARRHLYLYPIKKGIRERLRKVAMVFPKDPAQYRFDQHWEGGARGADASNGVSGSIPEPSAN